MSCHLPKLLMVALCSTVLMACSSQHVLVKKSDMEAAEQCLLAQQARHIQADEQPRQLAETLELLRQMVEMQQRVDLAQQESMPPAGQGLEEDGVEPQCESDPPPGQATLEKMLVGSREPVLLTDLGIVLEARMDTGTTTSSLDARDIESFERNSEEWVRFKVQDPGLDQLVEVERKRSRQVLITHPNTEEPERRPVVEMRITLGSITQVAEFTLSDRSHLGRAMLIGRNVLRDLMLVDVAQSNVTEPQPPKPSDNGLGVDE